MQQLNVTLFGQETAMWCWAASCQMAMNYLGKYVEQCVEANDLFNMDNCCIQPTPKECIRGGSPQFQDYGFSSDQTPKGTALTFEQLQDQIANNMPVCFSWKWKVKGGHVMVAIGTATDPNGRKYVLINNPMPVNQGSQYWITYSNYIQGNNHTHGRDWYNITNLNAPDDLSTGQVNEKNMRAVFELAENTVNELNGYGLLTEMTTIREHLTKSQFVRGKAIPIKRIHPHVYGKDVSAEEAILERSELLIPLSGQGDKEAIRVSRNENGWQLDRICDPRVTYTILETISNNEIEDKGCFLLDAPERDRMFVGYYDNGELKLIPLLQPNRSVTLSQLLTEPFTSGWDEE